MNMPREKTRYFESTFACHCEHISMLTLCLAQSIAVQPHKVISMAIDLLLVLGSRQCFIVVFMLVSTNETRK